MRPEVLERIRGMKRASQVARAGQWSAADAVDRVALDAHERHRRRIVLTAEGGTGFLLDLPQATALHDGNGLVFDGGATITVVARPEPLVEIAVQDAAALARLAWHLGQPPHRSAGGGRKAADAARPRTGRHALGARRAAHSSRGPV